MSHRISEWNFASHASGIVETIFATRWQRRLIKIATATHTFLVEIEARVDFNLEMRHKLFFSKKQRKKKRKEKRKRKNCKYQTRIKILSKNAHRMLSLSTIKILNTKRGCLFFFCFVLFFLKK